MRITAYILIALGVALAAVGRLYSLHWPLWRYSALFLIPGVLLAVAGVVLLVRRYWNWPNAITVGRILLIPLVLFFLLPGIFGPETSYLAACLYVLISLSDVVDGMLARRLGRVTRVGKFLDPLADKIVYVTVLIAMIPRELVPVWLVLLVVVRELYITGLRTLALGEGMVIDANRGGKTKTAFGLVGVVGLLVFYPYEIDFFVARVTLDFYAIGLVLTYLSLAFSVWSAGQYTWQFGAELRRLHAARLAQAGTAALDAAAAQADRA